MPRMTMTAARREISEAVNRMVYGKGEPIVLTRRGKDLAAIVSYGGSEAHGGNREPGPAP